MMKPHGYPIDKSKWARGPWDDEPDQLEWTTEAGFPGGILRSDASGSLCGYVGVPPGHPWHGADHDSVEAEVHGGLTFSGDRPFKGDGLHWLGFDTGHYMDAMPLIESHVGRGFGGTYKTLAYVRAEVESLARQAKEAVE